jgi:hypothetical protein
LANDNTGDTLRSAASKINNNFQEVYRILGDSSSPTSTIILGASSIISEGSSADDYETTLAFANTTSSDKTITLPDLTGTVSLITATETLTNKTLTSPVITTPQINDTSADHQYVVAVSELAADRTVTLPLLAGADEFTFNAHTQTLTNKTLTSPVLTTPKVAQLNDTGGNETIKTPATGSAVNFLTVTNSATGGDVTVAADGSDSDVDLALSSKNFGSVVVSNTMVLKTQTLTGTGAADPKFPLTLTSNGGAFAVSLVDGIRTGQMHKFINLLGGVCTITPETFANGTTVALAQWAVAELIWTGATWVLTTHATTGTVPVVTVA